MDAEDYTVGVVAELTGVSVRTLHHYDQIGLLRPGQRNAAGYRLYSPEDLQRLQRLLFYRELGFGLDTIAAILADSESTDADHLRRHRQLLAGRIARCQAMMAVIDKELSARKMGISLTPRERLEVFGGTRLEDHAARAGQRWGGTAQWAQRQQRTAGYTRQDWLQLRTEQASIHQRLLNAMNDGMPATDPAVMDLAEEHRQHIGRWLHDCGYETHRELARAYRANERIGRNYDDMAPGLSRYIHDAIIANCQRAADPQAGPSTPAELLMSPVDAAGTRVREPCLFVIAGTCTPHRGYKYTRRFDPRYLPALIAPVAAGRSWPRPGSRTGPGRRPVLAYGILGERAGQVQSGTFAPGMRAKARFAA